MSIASEERPLWEEDSEAERLAPHPAPPDSGGKKNTIAPSCFHRQNRRQGNLSYGSSGCGALLGRAIGCFLTRLPPSQN